MDRPAKRQRVYTSESEPDNDSQHSSSHNEPYPVSDDSPSEDDQPKAVVTPPSRIKTKTKKPAIPPLPVNQTFASLGLSPWLVQSLARLSITTPTSIQVQAIPVLLAGKNCIGISRTGSGKTVSFLAPILDQWSRSPSGLYTLILTPTRELALQIHEQVLAIGAPANLKSLCITGGSDYVAQATALSRKPHILIATPGRLAEHIQNSPTEHQSAFRRLKYLILDEGDRLLKGNILPSVTTCLEILPPKAQLRTGLFTATPSPAEIRAAINSNPAETVVIDINSNSSNPEAGSLTLPPGLQQRYILVSVSYKETYLHLYLVTLPTQSVIVFTNRALTAQIIHSTLRNLKYEVTALHSNLTQRERAANLASFRARKARVLVATDLAARGLDIPAVEVVVNYDLPRDCEDYVHRVGRTARAGRDGKAVSLVGQRDVGLLRGVEGRVGVKMEEEGEGWTDRLVKGDTLQTVGRAVRRARLGVREGVKGSGRR